MIYAGGCACKPKDLCYGYDPHKVFMSKDRWGRKIEAAVTIISTCLPLLVKDVIENDVMIRMPSLNCKTYIMALAIRGEQFKECRLHRKFSDVDFLASDMTGYIIVYKFIFNSGYTRDVEIYVQGDLKLKLTDAINSGKVYYGRVEKSYDEYFKECVKACPFTNLTSVKYLLTFAFKLLYLLLYRGNELSLGRKPNLLYFGKMYYDPLRRFDHYRRVLSKKIKWQLTHSKKFKPNGTMFISVPEDVHRSILDGLASNKPINLPNLSMYANKALCILIGLNNSYLYKVQIPEILNYIKRDLNTSNIEFVEGPIRLTFKDILKSNRDWTYEAIHN